MPDAPPSRFTSANQTTNERLSTNTVGLVALSDFRKRRAEVLEQQEREARDTLRRAAASTPDRSLTATANNAGEASDAERQPKKANKRAKALVSFGADEDEDGGEQVDLTRTRTTGKKGKSKPESVGGDGSQGSAALDPSVGDGTPAVGNVVVNASVAIVPRAVTKAALRREAAERETLRKEFLAMQVAVKATEVAVPFVFYDGTNIPGGTVRVKKGDSIWAFLDKSRKVGAQLRVGGQRTAKARRAWARVSVDDLIMVRGSVIIPHHYDFYFFIINKTIGPGNQRLFEYSAKAPSADEAVAATDQPFLAPLPTAATTAALPKLSSLEGASDDPAFTKVVDRRWYERNKHIYPASVWQAFDPEKDYTEEIRRDPGGNAFFFSR